ncbi:MAG: ferrous iron transport protein A [Desulfarculaceae bacterium]|nr:ferrous iron transport protein A [Desulfarculaceae bacterium]
MSETQCLRKIPVDSTVCISRITGTGELARKIRDMGLVPGTRITVMGTAPLKDPVALRLDDFTLTLRNREADYIFVEKKEE